MIVGNGLLAKAFEKYKNDDRILIFASGVSNSLEENKNLFLREENLLIENLKNNPSKKFIYFSTCSVYDGSLKESHYVKHKLKMESIIEAHHSNFLILRLSNIVGGIGNRNTLINFFITSILDESPIQIWRGAIRNLLDINDVLIIFELIKDRFHNEIINVANTESYSVLNILTSVENHLSKKAITTYVDKGSSYTINLSKIEKVVNKVIPNSTIYYLDILLKRHY